MRRLLAIASVLVIGAFTTASATASRQGPAIANLTGTQEVITTGTSTPGTSLATGLATFRLSEDGQALRYRLSVSQLTGIFQALSFLGLGAVLMGIAWFYQQLLFPRRVPAAPGPN